MYLTSLFLRNFRSYRSYDATFSDGFVIFVGDNGVGKTNILEAVSLLTSGRGLRGLHHLSYLGYNGQSHWHIEGCVYHDNAPITLKAITDNKGKGRVVSVDDKRIALTDLSLFFSALWLLPEEESLWRQTASCRRHFLDRIAPHLFPAYTSCRKRYKKGLMERQSLLRVSRPDIHWLGGVEKEIAKTGIILASYRYELIVHLLKKVLEKLCLDYHLPMFTLSLEGDLEKVLHHKGASLAEDWFLQKLLKNREHDTQTGRCSYGPHLCDIRVFHRGKNISASQCSKGEQSVISLLFLVSLCLCIRKRTGNTPILLLDEMLSYLDTHFLTRIMCILTSLNTQILMTGTPENTVTGLPNLHKIALP